MKLHHTIFILFFSVLPLSALAAVYKTVDEDGNVTFTDSKLSNENAEEIKLKPITQIPPASVKNNYSNSQSKGNKTDGNRYNKIKIIEPANNATIRGNGNVVVRISLSPELSYSHRVRVLMNGQPVDKPERSLNVHIPNIERGTHRIKAEVIDQKGKIVKSTESTFYVHRVRVRQAVN